MWWWAVASKQLCTVSSLLEGKFYIESYLYVCKWARVCVKWSHRAPAGMLLSVQQIETQHECEEKKSFECFFWCGCVRRALVT